MEVENNLKFGQIIAYLTSVMTFVTFAVAITAIPNSGTNCPSNCISYPYLDIRDEFPRDYYWMVLAIFMLLIYLVLVTIIHHINREKVFSHIGMNLAQLSVLVIVVNYYLQLRIIQASLVNNETLGIPLLTQYNPNGVFIALEEVGFLILCLSLLFCGLSFTKKTRTELWIGRLTIINAAITMGAFVFLLAQWGLRIEDRFEVIVITLNWITLLVFGILVGKTLGYEMTNKSMNQS